MVVHSDSGLNTQPPAPTEAAAQVGGGGKAAEPESTGVEQTTGGELDKAAVLSPSYSRPEAAGPELAGPELAGPESAGPESARPEGSPLQPVRKGASSSAAASEDFSVVGSEMSEDASVISCGEIEKDVEKDVEKDIEKEMPTALPLQVVEVPGEDDDDWGEWE